MKRLLLFISLLGSGLAIMVVFLGPDDLLRSHQTTEIQTTAMEDMDEALAIERRLKMSLVEMVEGPISEPVNVTQPDGTTKLVHRDHLRLPDIQKFDQGLISSGPELELFDEQTGQELRAHLTARFATIIAPGFDLQDFAGGEPLNVNSIELSQDVVLLTYDAEQQPLYELTTSLIELPGAALRRETEGQIPPIECPKPVQLRRVEDSIVIRGNSCLFNPAEQLLILDPPVEVILAELSLVGATRDTAADRAEPVRITADGPLIYRWREGSPRGSEDRAEGLANLLSNGTLTLEDNVLGQQGNDWFLADRIVANLNQEEPAPGAGGQSSPRVRVESLTAEGRGRSVSFGLFGGTGQASRLNLSEQATAFDLVGPVQMDQITLALEGDEPIAIEKLRAKDRVLFAKKPYQDDPEALWIHLTGEAAVDAPGRWSLKGDDLVLTFAGENSPAAGTPAAKEAPRQLRRLQLIGTPALIELEANEDQPFEASGRGNTVAIDLWPDGQKQITLADSAFIHLVGREDSPFEVAELEGPDIQLSIDSNQDHQLDIPDLEHGYFLVPAHSSLLDIDGRTHDTTTEASLATRIDISPLEQVRFRSQLDLTELSGRCRYQVHQQNKERMRLLSKNLKIARSEAGPSATARGDVEIHDFEQHMTIRAESAEFGSMLRAHGSERLPAQVILPLEGTDELVTIRAQLLQWNREDNQLLARYGRDGLAEFEVPSSAFLGALRDRDGSVAPLLEDSDEIAGFTHLYGQVIEADLNARGGEPGKKQFGRLAADGRVRIFRDADGLELLGEHLNVEYTERKLFVRGGEQQHALLRRPVPGFPEHFEEVRADWFLVEENRELVRIAEDAWFTFYVRDQEQPADLGRQVRVHTNREAELLGDELESVGGVQTVVKLADGVFEAEAERLLVRFDQPLLNGGRAERIVAQQDVLLQHQGMKCSGTRLSFDLNSGWFELKSGIELCRFLAASDTIPIPVDSRFYRLRGRIPAGDHEFPVSELEIEQLVSVVGR